MLAALRFKCDVLWSQLDALHFAYVEPGLIPPGAFVPKEWGGLMDRLVVSDGACSPSRRTSSSASTRCGKRWIILAPERLMLPDEQAVEILQLVDGKTGVAAIVDSLAARYSQAPRELIAKDVTAMLQDLADKGCLAGADPD